MDYLNNTRDTYDQELAAPVYRTYHKYKAAESVEAGTHYVDIFGLRNAKSALIRRTRTSGTITTFKLQVRRTPEETSWTDISTVADATDTDIDFGPAGVGAFYQGRLELVAADDVVLSWSIQIEPLSTT